MLKYQWKFSAISLLVVPGGGRSARPLALRRHYLAEKAKYSIKATRNAVRCLCETTRMIYRDSGSNCLFPSSQSEAYMTDLGASVSSLRYQRART